MDLPDAPGGGPRARRELPDLRHGAGAEDHHRRGDGEPRAGRHAAAIRGGPAASGAADAGGDGPHAPGRLGPRVETSPARPWIELALATPVVLWAGWPLLVRAAAVAAPPQPQHVHADRARGVSGLRLQRRGRGGAGRLPPGAARRRRRGRRLLRSGGRHRHPGAARPGARAASARANGRRAAGADGAGAEDGPPRARWTVRTDEDVPLDDIKPATGSASAPARRSLSTAPSSRGRAPSTNR